MTIKFAIHAFGTRGDVQPYIALARELIARGHAVSLAAPAQFESFVTAHSVGFFSLPGEFLELLDSPEARSAIDRGQGFSAGFRLLSKVRPMMHKLLDAEAEHARAFGPDVFIHHPKSLAVPHLAELLKVPAFLASPLPGFTPTAAFPSPILPFASLGPLNRMSHQLPIKAANLLFGSVLKTWRSESLGISARRSASYDHKGTFYAYSPHVLPKPADWDSDVCVSGYLFLDEPNYEPPGKLVRFLKNGEPPVYIGFGSMPGVEADKTARSFVEALSKAGLRGIIATGGGALARVSAPSSVLFIEGAPHEWLFPRMRAIVHHGGAGTTGAALRAGKPSAICPFFGDQPFWGRVVERLGVGCTLNRKRLSPETIGKAMATLDDVAIIKRTAAIGALVGREAGAAAAAEFIELRLRTRLD